jgi:membrane-associated phospholipid phosphatase
MGFDMRWKNIFSSFLVFTALIVSGCLYLDIRLAEFVSQKVGFDFLFSGIVSNAPDLLFILVCLITVVSWTGRFCLAGKPGKGRIVNFLENIGLAVPVAFVLKDLLKELFGRTNTRIWLLHPDLFGFHWFHGGGDFASFPSGHMAVFTVLLLGIGRCLPWLRPVCAGLLFVLALVLIVTQYHFFSDIVAGACLGVIVDLLTWRGLAYFRDSKNPQTNQPSI